MRKRETEISFQPRGGGNEGQASWSLGFPPITEIPVKKDGIPPQRRDFNGILHALSQHLAYLQRGAFYPYEPSLVYDTAACVLGSDGQIYSLVTPNGPGTSAGVQDPVKDTHGRYWKLAKLSGGGEIPVASTSTLGGVKVGDSTIKIKNGVIYVPEAEDFVTEIANIAINLLDQISIATTSKVGLMKPDGTTCNVNSSGTLTVIGGGTGLGMAPSTKYVTLSSSGYSDDPPHLRKKSFTAPANGYYFLFTDNAAKIVNEANLMSTNSLATLLDGDWTSTKSNGSSEIYLPVKKGQKVTFYWNKNFTPKYMRFIYAEA